MYFRKLTKAVAALELEGAGFLYSIVNRLSILEEKDPDSVAQQQSEFEAVLENKPLKELAKSTSRLTSKKDMESLEADVKYVLQGKTLDQFLRECIYRANKTPKVSKKSTHFRDWLSTSDFKHMSV